MTRLRRRFRDVGTRYHYFHPGPPLVQIRTRHGILFACNEAHLDALEAYVLADLRERRRDEFGWSMSSMARLPRWAKSAKNRAEVLRAIARMRRLLARSRSGRAAA
jgi:hypothetical protein